MPDEKAALAPQGAGEGPPKAASPPAEQSTEPEAAPADGVTVEQQPEPGPIPYARFKEVNERAKALESAFSRYFTVDQQTGQAVLRPEVTAQAAQQPKQDTQEAIQRFAERYGFLPEQVEGVLQLVDYISDQKASQRTAPLLQATSQQIRDGLVKSTGVPPEAASFVTKWVDTAQRLNPYALLTQEGRDTVVRQALGEYYLQQLHAGKSPAKAPQAPALEGGGAGKGGGNKMPDLPPEVFQWGVNEGIPNETLQKAAAYRKVREGR